MIGTVLRRVRKWVRGQGFDLVRYDPRSNYLALRQFLLKKYAIDLLLDVGANVGGFGIQMRDLGYTGNIVSFEPIKEVFTQLSKVSAADGKWHALNYALGDFDGQSVINISANNAESSSILEIRPITLEAAASAQYLRREEIQVRRLDGVYESVCAGSRSIYLKIDAQGFEKKILDGAAACLSMIGTVHIELSFESLYENDSLFLELCALLQNAGFRPVTFEPGFLDMGRGQMLQVDGIFHRF